MNYHIKIKVHRSVLESLVMERSGEAADVLGYLRGAVLAATDSGGSVEVLEVNYV